MLAKIIPRPGAATFNPTNKTRLFSTLPLVYDLHSPTKPTVPNAQTSPIIMMHGLFGSKKNNRTISK